MVVFGEKSPFPATFPLFSPFLSVRRDGEGARSVTVWMYNSAEIEKENKEEDRREKEWALKPVLRFVGLTWEEKKGGIAVIVWPLLAEEGLLCLSGLLRGT
jgi:hypothetical protein